MKKRVVDEQEGRGIVRSSIDNTNQPVVGFSIRIWLASSSAWIVVRKFLFIPNVEGQGKGQVGPARTGLIPASVNLFR